MTFGIRGLPQGVHAPSAQGAVWLAGCAVVLAVLDVVVEGRSFRTVVPLEDPDAVLPAEDALRHHLFDGGLMTVLLLLILVFSLPWNSVAALCYLPLIGMWLLNAAYGTYWERRRGLLLWRGHVPAQPRGTGQIYYSSVRRPAHVPDNSGARSDQLS
ncbi:hypothetical protein [Actinacidiphila acididurans]|uniref:Uncharacterized protein n=1 Tax=Actinacidiphila acididurans TaxID=2784346 RepID=A0ABS2TS91_9ACTN|nr:hypothetical protein [Actinacidiphila acididurans]MBM9506208.1 hypothetical protein [Actinacidiphila acididurans]